MTRGDWPGITGLNDVPRDVAARAYAAAGLPGIPGYTAVVNETGTIVCECREGKDCGSPGKHPRVKRKSITTVTDAMVREWWEQWPHANICILTGARSGWIVLDLDLKEDTSGESELDMWLETNLGLGWSVDKLAETSLVQVTGGGGKHVILRSQHAGEIRPADGWLPGVDVKGETGYIVVSPSRHVSGRQYRWINENSPGEVPTRLMPALLTAKGNASGASDETSLTDEEYRAGLRGGPAEGTRDKLFNRHTFTLRKRGLSKPDATHELRQLWEKTPGGGVNDGSPPFAWPTVLEKIERIWNDVQPDESPVSETMQSWARGSLRLVTSDGERVNGASGASGVNGASGGDDQDPPGEPPRGRVVNESPRHAELATDLGTAIRFARVLGDRVRYVHGIGWFVWNGLYWQLDESKVIVHMMHEVIADIRYQAEVSDTDERDRWITWAISCESAGRIFSILRLAESVPSISLLPTDLDADPWLLVTKSGTLDLKSGLIRPDEEARAAYCTRSADVEWDPDADCPNWKKHVRLVASRHDGTLDVDLETFLMRWAGYTLTGLVDEQKFAFLYGDGNNGKNVFIETLMRVMGTYAITQSAKLLTGTGQEHETIIADLAGPRLVFVDETPKGRINETRVKQLTGANKIRARRIAKDSFEFDARFKLWIAGNHKPRVADTSEGLWRRLDLIPFDTSIPANQRVRNYAEVLFENEGPGILRLAVEGLRAYRELGLAPPTRVDSAKRSYREEENLFGQFVSETFATDTDETHRTWHPNPLIHGLYEAWCHGNGVRHVQSMQQLADDLERNSFAREPKTRRIRTALGGQKVVRGWWGPPVAVEVPGHLVWTP